MDEEPTKTGFGPVTGSEENRNKYKLADSGDNFRDPDARARSDCHKPRVPWQWDLRLTMMTGAIGIGGNMTGDAVAGNNEYIRVSMITVG